MVNFLNYDNLPVHVLKRISPYVDRLAAKEIPPLCTETLFSEAFGLLQGIKRIIASQVPPDPNAIKLQPVPPGCFSKIPETALRPAQSDLDAHHARNMAMLSSLMRQMEILRNQDLDDFWER